MVQVHVPFSFDFDHFTVNELNNVAFNPFNRVQRLQQRSQIKFFTKQRLVDRNIKQQRQLLFFSRHQVITCDVVANVKKCHVFFVITQNDTMFWRSEFKNRGQLCLRAIFCELVVFLVVRYKAFCRNSHIRFERLLGLGKEFTVEQPCGDHGAIHFIKTGHHLVPIQNGWLDFCTLCKVEELVQRTGQDFTIIGKRNTASFFFNRSVERITIADVVANDIRPVILLVNRDIGTIFDMGKHIIKGFNTREDARHC